ncbi:O-antigen ligase family protein [Herbaspirillum robiniae]|uniref:O-antigen ligase family protein n=1 Tax=Herbaspirillum robiniae TaxID=2014887 RepID=UPI003D77C762
MSHYLQRIGRTFGIEKCFEMLIVYYWILLYVPSGETSVDRSSWTYLMYVLPVLTFSTLFGLPLLLRKSLSKSVVILIAYTLLVSAIALVRADYATIASTYLLCATLAVIYANQLRAPLSLLNALLLASIVAGTLTNLLGTNLYSVIPGLSRDNELWWRISLFPQVATSAFFCLTVFFLNILFRSAALRKTTLCLSAYFLFGSGLRSALLATMLAGLYYLLLRLGILKSNRAKLIYFFGAIIGFVTSLLASPLLIFLSGNEFVNSFLFRTHSATVSEADVFRTIYRTWIWSEHIRMAADEPIIGLGTFNFIELAQFNPFIPSVSTGSESFITGLYTRVGLLALLFLWAIYTMIGTGLRHNRSTPLIAGLIFAISLLSYGSFINPYNLVFLIIVSSMTITKSQDVKKCKVLTDSYS